MSLRPVTLMLVVLAASLAVAQSLPPRAIAALPSAPSAVRAQFSFRATHEVGPAPLSAHQKFRHFARSLYSPYTFASGLYDATWAQATGGSYRYGGGMEGWGKRLGSAYAGTAAGQFFGYFLFPTLLKQDPRYFPLDHGSVLARIKHAAERVVVTRGDDGTTQFNASGLLGMAATCAAQNLWLPPGHRTGLDTANRMLGSVQGAATGYLLREFTPDLIRFFRHHSPESLRKVEQKIPAQIISGGRAGND